MVGEREREKSGGSGASAAHAGRGGASTGARGSARPRASSRARLEGSMCTAATPAAPIDVRRARRVLRGWAHGTHARSKKRQPQNSLLLLLALFSPSISRRAAHAGEACSRNEGVRAAPSHPIVARSHPVGAHDWSKRRKKKRGGGGGPKKAPWRWLVPLLCCVESSVFLISAMQASHLLGAHVDGRHARRAARGAARGARLRGLVAQLHGLWGVVGVWVWRSLFASPVVLLAVCVCGLDVGWMMTISSLWMCVCVPGRGMIRFCAC